MNRTSLMNAAWFLAFVMTLSMASPLRGQEPDDDLLEVLMNKSEEDFQLILSDPEKYRVQILYTQIDRDSSNRPQFRSYGYRLDPSEYFYPASSIKIFGAALSLEKFKRLKVPDLGRETWVRIDSSFSGQQRALIDTTAASGRPSFAHYIRKLLVLSDNEAYNRTYEFLGQEEINERLRVKGYDGIRLTHRLSVFLSPEENRNTNAMEFYLTDPERTIFRQAAMRSSKDYRALEPILLGKAYADGEEIVNEPMDFAAKNYCSVSELQKVIQSLIFPESLNADERFDLEANDYDFLRTYMSQLPRETDYKEFSKKPDNYCKFLLYGDQDSARIPESIRIFNKIGLAYGFCIDNAYIVDFDTGIEFMLTAVIYVNENQILNDGEYEYESVAFPFMGKLGRTIYEYELNRTRDRAPDLDRFKLTYDVDQNSSSARSESNAN